MGAMSKFVEGFFFREDNRLYWRPDHFQWDESPFEVRTKSGNIISGTVVRSRKFSEKTDAPLVLYFHSAQFNYSYNLLQTEFLTDMGFRVAFFDYSGCGRSTGKISFANIEDDAEAVFSVLAEKDASFRAKGRIILFGQGIGADAALHFYDRHPDKVFGLILEDVYASRKGWLKGHFGLVIGDIAAALLEPEGKTNGEILPKLKVPALIVWPEKSTYIFNGERKRVRALLNPKAKELMAPKARFLNVFVRPRAEVLTAVTEFLKKKCGAEGKPDRA
jgi:hypothetical protein